MSGRSRKEIGENLFAFSFYGNVQFRHLLKEPLLVGLDDRASGDYRGSAMGAHQRGDALELFEKEGDGTDADDIRLKLIQGADEAVVVWGG